MEETREEKKEEPKPAAVGPPAPSVAAETDASNGPPQVKEAGGAKFETAETQVKTMEAKVKKDKPPKKSSSSKKRKKDKSDDGGSKKRKSESERPGLSDNRKTSSTESLKSEPSSSAVTAATLAQLSATGGMGGGNAGMEGVLQQVWTDERKLFLAREACLQKPYLDKSVWNSISQRLKAHLCFSDVDPAHLSAKEVQATFRRLMIEFEKVRDIGFNSGQLGHVKKALFDFLEKTRTDMLKLLQEGRDQESSASASSQLNDARQQQALALQALTGQAGQSLDSLSAKEKMDLINLQIQLQQQQQQSQSQPQQQQQQRGAALQQQQQRQLQELENQSRLLMQQHLLNMQSANSMQEQYTHLQNFQELQQHIEQKRKDITGAGSTGATASTTPGTLGGADRVSQNTLALMNQLGNGGLNQQQQQALIQALQQQRMMDEQQQKISALMQQQQQGKDDGKNQKQVEQQQRLQRQRQLQQQQAQQAQQAQQQAQLQHQQQQQLLLQQQQQQQQQQQKQQQQQQQQQQQKQKEGGSRVNLEHQELAKKLGELGQNLGAENGVSAEVLAKLVTAYNEKKRAEIEELNMLATNPALLELAILREQNMKLNLSMQLQLQPK